MLRLGQYQTAVGLPWFLHVGISAALCNLWQLKRSINVSCLDLGSNHGTPDPWCPCTTQPPHPSPEAAVHCRGACTSARACRGDEIVSSTRLSKLVVQLSCTSHHSHSNMHAHTAAVSCSIYAASLTRHLGTKLVPDSLKGLLRGSPWRLLCRVLSLIHI